MKQVQARDKIKDKIVREKYCYEHYIIKDMGRKNKNFVIKEFNQFIEHVNEKYSLEISLDDYEVNMKEYYNQKMIKKEKKEYKCIDCNGKISRGSKRCLLCQKMNQRICQRPSLETLLEEVEKLGYAGTGRKYSVSPTSIRKWIKNYQKELASDEN